MRTAIASCLIAGLSLVPVTAQACDIGAGEKLFARCGTCHATEPGRHVVGPSLFGVVGRPVASLPGYRYSEALKRFGENLTWDPERLAVYLANPRQVVPGTRMGFSGLPKRGQRADVICYLETLQ